MEKIVYPGEIRDIGIQLAKVPDISININNIIETQLVNKVFPKLVTDDKKLLVDHIHFLVNYINIKFVINDTDNVWDQLSQNNYLDLHAVMNLLLPFIDDDGEGTGKKQLETLNDLYMVETKPGVYKYTNVQINRCLRVDNTFVKRKFDVEYFMHNFYLLLMSIDTVAQRLYVNWVDILPLTLEEYHITDLAERTHNKIMDEPKVVHLWGNYLDTDKGLSYQTIYNTISNHLFHEIKPIRWLIYDISSTNSDIFINYLEKIFPLKSIYDEIPWSLITATERNKFNESWVTFKQSNNPINNYIIQKMYFYFAKYYRNSRLLIENGQLLISKRMKIILRGDDDEDNEREQINEGEKGMHGVPAEDIYAFLMDQITAYRKTWFYVISFDDMDYIELPDIPEKIIISVKNIYNLAKSLIHYTDPLIKGNKYVPMPKLWTSLTGEMVEMFLGRLLNFQRVTNDNYHNDWNGPNWFNINGYFRRIYPQIPRSSYSKLNMLIYQQIRSKLYLIIPQCMIIHGTFSYYRPIPLITNKKNIPAKNSLRYKHQQMKIAHFTGKNKELYLNEAYYYQTGKKYSQLKPLILKGKNNSETKTYFDYLTSSQLWTFTYAMDWISQINFYHHYLNNRVIYVTGSTGVGKSTQIPKLLAYSLIMLDYNFAGKIVCTQPRIQPTVQNANTVSRELGLPIVEYNTKLGNISTDNFQVQYRHQKDKHTAPVGSFLKFVTDGTLYQEIINSPFLTKTRVDDEAKDDQGNKLDWVKQYSDTNLYDIIIVDEAHEHNANMDMILTLMRPALYINNSLKLVIVSATMEDDEPIYRRYYRDINDNRAYPLSMFIFASRLDRVNVDRRFHISPPGSTTQFLIEDIYLSEAESKQINENNFVEYGIQKTIKVANESSEGDILLFMSGQSDIIKSVKQINSATPSNVIALPYYAELSADRKELVGSIHEALPSYDIAKEDVLLSSDTPRKVAKGTYTRAIIVATNVAEASITITNLKYVIDTGYAKNAIYDPISNVTKIKIMPISRSSSQQRRGRVGRVSSGTVYYLYSKEKVENNKTRYGIADQDISSFIEDLLQKELDDSPIINYKNDINMNYSFLLNTKPRETSEIDHLCKILKNPFPYIDIIENQYKINSHEYYVYIGDTTHAEYSNVYFPGYTGYNINILLDYKLSFYIIHPDESIIIREPHLGKFVANNFRMVEDKYAKNVEAHNRTTYKVRLALLRLYTNNIIKGAKIDFIMPIYNSDVKGNQKVYVQAYYRTDKITTINYINKKYSAMLQVKKNLGFTMVQSSNQLKFISYGIVKEIFSDILALIIIIQSGDISYWIDNKYMKGSRNVKIKYINMFQNINGSENGDIHAFWVFWRKISEALPEIFYESTTIPNIGLILQKLKYDYLHDLDMNEDDYQIIRYMFKAGLANTDNETYYYVQLKNYPGLDINMENIKSICEAYMMDYEKISDMLKTYANSLYIINKNIWMSNYQKKIRMEEDIDPIEKLIQELYNSDDPCFQTHDLWTDIYYIYVRSFSNHLAVTTFSNNIRKYEKVDISKSSKINIAEWLPSSKLEKTLLKGTHQYLIYANNTVVSNQQSLNYLTPVDTYLIDYLNREYIDMLSKNTKNKSVIAPFVKN
jgi:hypothetical protein